MLDLMAVGQDKGPVPLYMHTVQRILREMRLLQQESLGVASRARVGQEEGRNQELVF
jgi:hypothetical protein